MLEKFIENFLMKSKVAQQAYVERILLAGSIQNFSEYKAIVGKLSGLKEADAIVRSLYKNMIDNSHFRDRNEEVENKDDLDGESQQY